MENESKIKKYFARFELESETFSSLFAFTQLLMIKWFHTFTFKLNYSFLNQFSDFIAKFNFAILQFSLFLFHLYVGGYVYRRYVPLC